MNRYGTPNHHASATQDWSIGDAVKVGFLTGLTIIAKIPTPGDYAPDAWVLQQRTSGRFYRFVPHHGIERRDSLADAKLP